MRRLIRRQEVEKVTGFGRAFIYRQMAAGRFPQAVKIGPKAVAWVEDQIQEWIEDRIAESAGKRPTHEA